MTLFFIFSYLLLLLLEQYGLLVCILMSLASLEYDILPVREDLLYPS